MGELFDSLLRKNEAMIGGLPEKSFVLMKFEEDGGIVDVSRVLATLGVRSGWLSRQFQKALDHLREFQAERAESEYHQLSAAAMLQLHKRKRFPRQPADDGFVFSEEHIEQFSERTGRLEKGRPLQWRLRQFAPVAHTHGPSACPETN